MTFTFLHTADWQLGKGFGQFPDDVAAALRTARMDVISHIAEAAKARKITHILVAGDVWDSTIPSNAVLRQPVTIMAEHPELQWWLLPGNHDADGPDGLWDRVASIAPDNLHVLRDALPVEIDAGTYLLPSPWQRIQHGQDLTQWMDAADTPKGVFRIGLAHGAVKGFGTEGDTDREIIPPDRAERARLDYLALGDWHARSSINARTHYSGTPEPDRHKSGARGQVLCVTIEAGRDPVIEDVPTAQYDWPILKTELAPDSVEQWIADCRDTLSKGQPLRRTQLRLELSGQATVEDWTKMESFLDEMRGECGSLILRGDASVSLVVVPEDIDALDAQGSVRDAATDLLARREDPDLSKADRDIAADALRLLLRYGAENA